MIPYGKQDISEADVQAVVDVLQSDYLTQGPVVPQFEKQVARYCGAKYATAVNSATSALHLACLVLGVGPGDVVWTSPITFVASANCARYCGADIDFVDIDPRSYNMSVEKLAEKLAEAAKSGRLPKVVIPVHMAGQPCDMREIHKLSVDYGFSVIEDASHAIGGRIYGEPVGNCQFSDVTVFSFHPVKIITTAEGGMAMTNNHALYQEMELLRSHAITRDEDRMTHVPDGPWYYQQIGLGFNYRMTDIQAALGLSQLERLDTFVAKRHEVARRYDELLEDTQVVTPSHNPEYYSGMHLYIIRLQIGENRKSQKEIFREMRSKGIGVNLHYIPVYHQPYYEELGFQRGYCGEAEQYYNEAMSIPVYPKLSLQQQDQVVEELQKAIEC